MEFHLNFDSSEVGEYVYPVIHFERFGLSAVIVIRNLAIISGNFLRFTNINWLICINGHNNVRLRVKLFIMTTFISVAVFHDHR